MSVNKIQSNTQINTICPLVVNNTDAILTFQTASKVVTNQNVNSKFSSCNPTDYDYLVAYTSAQVHKCCSNNAVQKKMTQVPSLPGIYY